MFIKAGFNTQMFISAQWFQGFYVSVFWPQSLKFTNHIRTSELVRGAQSASLQEHLSGAALQLLVCRSYIRPISTGNSLECNVIFYVLFMDSWFDLINVDFIFWLFIFNWSDHVAKLCPSSPGILFRFWVSCEDVQWLWWLLWVPLSWVQLWVWLLRQWILCRTGLIPETALSCETSTSCKTPVNIPPKHTLVIRLYDLIWWPNLPPPSGEPPTGAVSAVRGEEIPKKFSKQAPNLTFLVPKTQCPAGILLCNGGNWAKLYFGRRNLIFLPKLQPSSSITPRYSLLLKWTVREIAGRNPRKTPNW